MGDGNAGTITHVSLFCAVFTAVFLLVTRLAYTIGPESIDVQVG